MVGLIIAAAASVHLFMFMFIAQRKQDQLKLLRCCVKAMKTTDTSARLTVVQSHMQNSLNTLAAKCALKSLNLG